MNADEDQLGSLTERMQYAVFEASNEAPVGAA
jgi:hypothetical protein